MALAIRFHQLIRDDVVADQAELARIANVTRARLTQIMNLLNLSPTIQLNILGLPGAKQSLSKITERQLRCIVSIPEWSQQHRFWDKLYNGCETL